MNDDVRVLELLDLEAEPRKIEMIARREGGGITLLDRPELTAIAKADRQERLPNWGCRELPWIRRSRR